MEEVDQTLVQIDDDEEASPGTQSGQVHQPRTSRRRLWRRCSSKTSSRRYPEAPTFHFLTDGRGKGQKSVIFSKKGRIRRFLFERVKSAFLSVFTCVHICLFLCVCECDDLCVCERDQFFSRAFAFVISHSPPTKPLYLSSRTRKLLHQNTREHRHVYCHCDVAGPANRKLVAVVLELCRVPSLIEYVTLLAQPIANSSR